MIHRTMQGFGVVAALPGALSASLSAAQNADIGVGDHVKWDTVDDSRGASIALDTTSSYTSAAGASLGRLTLAPGRYYLLVASCFLNFSGNTGNFAFGWYRDSGVQIGNAAARNIAITRAINKGVTPTASVIIRPEIEWLVEVRMTAVTALTSIGSAQSWMHAVELAA